MTKPDVFSNNEQITKVKIQTEIRSNYIEVKLKRRALLHIIKIILKAYLLNNNKKLL